MNYYTILGVSQYAKYIEIKAAYRRLALKYHPDRNSSPISENSIKIINAAFEVLSDRDKRRQYDEKAIYNNKANKKKDQTQSSSSSPHVTSSNTVYSNSYRTGNDDEFHNTVIKKGNRNETDVKSGKVSSLTNVFHKSIGRIHITIEPTLCMAFGSCETLAPNVFVVDKDKMINPKATLKSGTGDDFEAILAAAQTCPTKAIIITDRYTGEQIYP
ncbi:MAG TPA: DnaJ domain-containing protein [Nitrososphaeraceae archaeon]|nr:DnaJ domain-containing protein [Nitrososphaeraceae archaeon]